MAHHDVLIHLRRTDAATPAVAIGLALAERLRAWTTGIHVVPIAPAAFASPEAVALQVHEADRDGRGGESAPATGGCSNWPRASSKANGRFRKATPSRCCAMPRAGTISSSSNGRS